jgi:hypothetical protein
MPHTEFTTPFAAPRSPKKTFWQALAASRPTAWFVPPLIFSGVLAALALYLLLWPS